MGWEIAELWSVASVCESLPETRSLHGGFTWQWAVSRTYSVTSNRNWDLWISRKHKCHCWWVQFTCHMTETWAHPSSTPWLIPQNFLVIDLVWESFPYTDSRGLWKHFMGGYINITASWAYFQFQFKRNLKFLLFSLFLCKRTNVSSLFTTSGIRYM